MWTKKQIIDAGEVAELYDGNIRHLISVLEREFPTTKTILEWLEELPEPYRTQAIENYENSLESNLDKKTYPQVTLWAALYDAFYWKESPQGHEYWVSLFNKLNMEGLRNEN